MDAYRPLDSWWELVLPPLALALLVWWVGPIEFATFVAVMLALVVVVGIPLQFVVQAATRGR